MSDFTTTYSTFIPEIWSKKLNQMLEKNFKKVFKNIKNEILNAQYDIYKSANIRTLALYSY